MKRVFLDYLDFNAFDKSSEKKRFYRNHIKLVGDILSFPDAVFFVAAPAIAKCRDTALLLTLPNRLWDHSRFKYVLSPSYNGDFSMYVEERKRKLQNSFSVPDLNQHFEYIGYTNNIWPVFFNDYLNTGNEASNYSSRLMDCDSEFRNKVKLNMANDDFADTLNQNGFCHPDGIIDSIESLVNDKSVLFQRESITRSVISNNSPRIITDIINSTLDSSFSNANASSIDAKIPRQSQGVNGYRLKFIADGIMIGKNKTLGNVFYNMSLDDATILSEQVEWKAFIRCLSTSIIDASLIAKGDRNILKMVMRQLPQNRSNFVRSIGSMLVAYFLSNLYPIFGFMEKIVSSIFTNIPSGVISQSTKLMSSELMDATESIKNLIYRNFSRSYHSEFHMRRALNFYREREVFTI